MTPSTASRLEPVRRGSLLFTIQFPEIPGTRYVMEILEIKEIITIYEVYLSSSFINMEIINIYDMEILDAWLAQSNRNRSASIKIRTFKGNTITFFRIYIDDSAWKIV